MCLADVMRLPNPALPESQQAQLSQKIEKLHYGKRQVRQPYNDTRRRRASLAQRRGHQGAFPGIGVRRHRRDVCLYLHRRAHPALLPGMLRIKGKRTAF